MNRLMFDFTPLLQADLVQGALVVAFAVVGTWVLGCIAVLLIIRDPG